MQSDSSFFFLSGEGVVGHVMSRDVSPPKVLGAKATGELAVDGLAPEYLTADRQGPTMSERKRTNYEHYNPDMFWAYYPQSSLFIIVYHLYMFSHMTPAKNTPQKTDENLTVEF